MTLSLVGRVVVDSPDVSVRMGYTHVYEVPDNTCVGDHVVIYVGDYDGITYYMHGKIVNTPPYGILQLSEKWIRNRLGLDRTVYIPLTNKGVIGDSYLLLSKGLLKVRAWSMDVLAKSILAKFLNRFNFNELLLEIGYAGTTDGLRLILTSNMLTLENKVIAATMLASVRRGFTMPDTCDYVTDYTVCSELLAEISRNHILGITDRVRITIPHMALQYVPIQVLESDSSLFRLHDALLKLTDPGTEKVKQIVFEHNVMSAAVDNNADFIPI